MCCGVGMLSWVYSVIVLLLLIGVFSRCRCLDSNWCLFFRFVSVIGVVVFSEVMVVVWKVVILLVINRL